MSKPVQTFRFLIVSGDGRGTVTGDGHTWFEAREDVRARYQGCDVAPAERISHATGERLP